MGVVPDLLHFYRPRSLSLKRGVAVVDPDDLPYVAACTELGAHAVYSKDKHFRQMDAPVISVTIDASLQSYARAGSIQFAVMIGSVFTVNIGVAAFNAAVGLIDKAFQAFQKLHPLLKFAVIAGLVFVFVHPKWRAKLAGLWRSVAKLAPPLLEALLAASEHVEIATSTVDAKSEEIKALLPVMPKRTALMHARAICLLQQKPIPLVEIENRMKADGYTTRAKNFPGYLRRVLRSSGQFIELSPDIWTLCNYSTLDYNG